MTSINIPPPLPRRSTAPDAPDILIVEEDEKNLSEQQLRDLYDSEEIDRFLSLFSAVECHLGLLRKLTNVLAYLVCYGSPSTERR